MQVPAAPTSSKTTFSLFDKVTLIIMHLGLLFLAEGITWHWTHSLSILQHRGTPIFAYVIGKGMTTGRGRHPFLTYRYVAGGSDQVWTRSDPVDEDDFDRSRIGETVPIVFDPESPQLAHLAWHDEVRSGNHLATFLLLSLLYVMIAAMSFGFAWSANAVAT